MHNVSVKRTSHEETMFLCNHHFRLTLNSKINVCDYIIM